MASDATLTLRGNLGTLEVKTTTKGRRFLRFTIATTPSRKVDGKWVRADTPVWWAGAAFTRKLMEAFDAGEIRVGDLVEVTGQASQTEFTARDGSLHHGVEIHAFSVRRIARKADRLAA